MAKIRFAEEEYAIWRDAPMTVMFLRVLRSVQEKARADWISLSWDGETLDPSKHAYLKARAELCEDLLGLSASDMKELLEQSPQEATHAGHADHQAIAAEGKAVKPKARRRKPALRTTEQLWDTSD